LNIGAEIDASCARTCSIVAPSCTRPIAPRNQTSRWSSQARAPCVNGSAQSGTATSNARPTSTPKNAGGVTPTMSNEWPSSMMLRPMAEGLRPKRVVQ
jgi:hypothetical protein